MCCGFANALLAGYAGEAAAQAGTPLRVDPVLLGLPPVKPEPVPAPAAKPAASGGSEVSLNPQPLPPKDGDRVFASPLARRMMRSSE